jgi:hypothetical protein
MIVQTDLLERIEGSGNAGPRVVSIPIRQSLYGGAGLIPRPHREQSMDDRANLLLMLIMHMAEAQVDDLNDSLQLHADLVTATEFVPVTEDEIKQLKKRLAICLS